jgi:hypothetical protein
MGCTEEKLHQGGGDKHQGIDEEEAGIGIGTDDEDDDDRIDEEEDGQSGSPPAFPHLKRPDLKGRL